MNAPDSRTLFERIGGAEFLDRLVGRFYDKVLDDPVLGPFFAHTSMAKLRMMQKEFLGAMLDGPMRYTGVGLSHAHANRGITLEHYRQFANLFLETLKEEGVAQGDIDQVLDRLNIYADDIRSKTSASG
ncbi:MAG: group 1 truncated hemoglobin [Isosphaeraceae bacterium]